MYWQQLKSFYYIAKLNNFTKAAEAVHRTQSALSQQIKVLEIQLGCTLFERIGRQGLVLTAEGKALLTFVEDVFAKETSLLQQLDAIRTQNQGGVRVGAAPTVAQGVLPLVLNRFKARHPGIFVSVYARHPEDNMEMVRTGFLDLGMTLESMVPHTLECHRWRESHFVLMTPKGHPLAQEPLPSLEAIFSYPLITTSGSKFVARQKFETMVSRRGLTVNLALESDHAMLSAEYVLKGLGICFMSLPEQVVHILKQTLEVVSLDTYFDPEYIVIYHRKTRLSMAADLFLDTLLEAGEQSI